MNNSIVSINKVDTLNINVYFITVIYKNVL